MMIVSNKFDLGQTVYWVTDTEQKPRIITAICVKPGYILYEVSKEGSSSWALEIEISSEINVLIKTDG